MKIKRIEIESFRNHIHTVMDTDKAFIVIKGANYAGKSSIAQAISMGLTPATISLPTDGKGFVKKIKKGESKATIKLDVQGGNHLVRQEVVLNTNTTGRTANSTCLDDPDWKPLPFDNMLKAKKEALLVALNTDHFLHSKLDEDDQKNLMAKLVLPSQYDFTEEIIKAVEKAVGEGAIDFTDAPFEVIKKAYKKLYDERQLVNRQVKEFKVPEAIKLEEGINSAAVNDSLTEARNRKAEIIKKRDAAIKKASEGDAERVRVQTKIDGIQEQVTAEQAKCDKLKEKVLSREDKAKAEEVAAGRARLDELTKERELAQATVTALEKEIFRLSGLIQQFSGDAATCPTCEQPVNVDGLTKILQSAQEEQVDAVMKANDIESEYGRLGDVPIAEKKLADNVAALVELEAIETAITEKKAQVELGKKKLASLGEKKDVTAEFNELLAAVDGEIETLNNQLRPIIVAEERAKEVASKTIEFERLKNKAETVDSLVKYFDKDGIKAKLLKQYIGGIEEKVNEVMSAFSYVCTLSIEPYALTVTNAKGDTNNVSELSGAEDRIFAAAFQCAVSRAAGIGIAVIDEVDRLHSEIRPTLNKALYTLINKGIMEQIILIVADNNQEAPKIPNSAFFFVDNGTVDLIGEA